MRKWIVFGLISCSAVGLYAQTPLTTADFDKHYRKKFRQAFCTDSIYNDCFSQAPDACFQKFDPLFSKCLQKVFPKRQLAFADHSSEKFNQLGQCIGVQLKPAGAKVTCRQRSQEF